MDSRYLDKSETVKRLVNEWRKHGKIIIAYDFDNTVYDYHQVGDTFNRIVDLLKSCKDDAYFVVFTSCGEEKYDFIQSYLTENNIPFDKINENIDFVPFNGRKIYYNILLDDRAGLESACRELATALEIFKGA